MERAERKYIGITGVLLAAGEGSRYFQQSGRCKLTESLPEKGLALEERKSVVRISAEKLLAVSDELIVVTGHWRKEVLQTLEGLPFTEHYSSHYRDGMGASIMAGIAGTRPELGWLIALGDMPSILPETYALIRDTLSEEKIVRPTYRSIPGHPVGFKSSLYSALASLDPSAGAQSLIRERRAECKLLPVKDMGILLDIDFPSDLQRASKRY